MLDWQDAVERARPIALGASARRSIVFQPNKTKATVFTQTLKRGQRTAWRLRGGPEAGRLFASLERQSEDGASWTIAAAVATDDARHEVNIDADEQYRFVLHPALFERFQGRFQVATGGQLGMPVVGARAYDIGGGFGVARDRGARAHKGVDIFAATGTPVTAVISGRVSHRERDLVGKAIFLSNGFTGPSYYYAHRSAFATAGGARVSADDVIGRVGATGHATSGPAHLHFGIYALGGAIDPAAFIQPKPALVEA